jgi:hypothetical protein
MSGFRGRKILLMAGCTFTFIVGSLLVLISLVTVANPFSYRTGEPEASDEQAAVRKRPVSYRFEDPTASPVTVSAVPFDTAASTSTGTPDGPSATPATVPIAPNDRATSRPADTLTQTSASATPMFTHTPTVSSASGSSITGRVLLDGATADGVTIKLEDQALNTVAETVVGADGAYNFSNLEPTKAGYNLVFSREWNVQFKLGQVISWGWVGPIPVAEGAVVQIPDFDISLLGFEPIAPVPKASLSAASVSPSSPIQFKWAAYPEATRYWVDLVHGQEQSLVWQSPVAESTSISFDGTLNSGARIQPGEYRWGVGAQRELGAYRLTVYGYLPALLIVP